MLSELRRLFVFVKPRRKSQLVLLMLLMLVGAIAEMATLGVVLPFVSVIADPVSASRYEPVRLAMDLLGIREAAGLVTPMTAIFVIVVLLACAIRLLLVWASQKFVQRLGYDFSLEVYRRTLHQPYSYHVSHNSSQLIGAVGKVGMMVGGMMMPLIQTVTGVIISAVIIATLIMIAPVISITAAITLGGLYLLVSVVARTRLRANGITIANAQGARVKALQEGLGGIRDLILDRTQDVYIQRFGDVDLALRNAQASNMFIGAAPRFAIEAVGMILIAIFALMLSYRDEGLMAALPSLGALALGAQRVLPLINQVYFGWSSLLSSRKAMTDVLSILDLPDESRRVVKDVNAPQLAFSRSVSLERVSFCYPADELPVLKDTSLEIRKGERIGFVGKTGSGKSTTTDIVMGLLAPTSGVIKVDGIKLTDANLRQWQACVAHVPQAIYLSDASIAENIAFGVPADLIDMDRVQRAAGRASLDAFVSGLPNRFYTAVGERGVRLSGGQRQRIGLARALYKEAQLLVLDEATSALDGETESEIMNAIESLDRDLTILIIAHRVSTLHICDVVYRLENGELKNEELNYRAAV